MQVRLKNHRTMLCLLSALNTMLNIRHLKEEYNIIKILLEISCSALSIISIYFLLSKQKIEIE